MKTGSLRIFSTAAQMFTVFVALSTLLGRIYFLKYNRTLAIPNGDNSINVLDYAVVSPNVTIMSFGITFVFATLIFSQSYFTGIETLNRKKWIIAVVLFAIATLIMVLVQFLIADVGRNLPGIYGLILTLTVLLYGLSGVFMFTPSENSEMSSDIDKLREQYTEALETGREEDMVAFSQNRKQILDKAENELSKLKPLLVLGAIGTVLYCSFLFVWYTNSIAVADAMSDYRDAPIVNVFLDQEANEDGFSELLGCEADVFNCAVNLVLQGDEFIYLRPRDIPMVAANRKVIGIPVRRVIYYAIEPR